MRSRASRARAVKASSKNKICEHLRGLDRAGLDGASKTVRLVRSGDKSPASAKKLADRIAGRDQRDYVRRIVKEITDQVKAQSSETEVKAVGMIGRDVHDKLVLAQALRAAFPDRVLFTTDLDARLLHPDVTGYTRNIIVASSLPLTLRQPLQVGVPPFRNSYQTATFLGARYAVVDDGKRGEMLFAAIRTELAKTSCSRSACATRSSSGPRSHAVRGGTARDLCRGGGGPAGGAGWVDRLQPLRAGHVGGTALAVQEQAGRSALRHREQGRLGARGGGVRLRGGRRDRALRTGQHGCPEGSSCLASRQRRSSGLSCIPACGHCPRAGPRPVQLAPGAG